MEKSLIGRRFIPTVKDPRVSLRRMLDLNEISVHPAVEFLRASERQKYDADYYANHYWREDLPGLVGNHGLSYDDPEHTLRFRFLYESIIYPYKPTRVLDAGCGPGLLLAEALSNDIDAWGVDWSPVAQELFTKRVPCGKWDRFTLSTIVNIPFADESFDLCICMDVLEHLPIFDIFLAVSELCRVCSARIICSINLDNPYQFHPTILSRDSWIALFESTELARLDSVQTQTLNQRVRERYCEYDMFVFQRIHNPD